MQLLWHYLVNASFSYLILIAVVRIVQEVKTGASSLLQSASRTRLEDET